MVPVNAFDNKPASSTHHTPPAPGTARRLRGSRRNALGLREPTVALLTLSGQWNRSAEAFPRPNEQKEKRTGLDIDGQF